MMNSADEKAKSSGSFAAGAVATISVVLAAIVLCISGKEAFIANYDKGLIAALLAVAIVAGSRALEGAEEEKGGKSRNAVPNAVQMSRSWLMCFVAIAAVFILTELISVSKPSGKGSRGAAETVGVSGTLRIETPTKTHTVQVVGRTDK